MAKSVQVQTRVGNIWIRVGFLYFRTPCIVFAPDAQYVTFYFDRLLNLYQFFGGLPHLGRVFESGDISQ